MWECRFCLFEELTLVGVSCRKVADDEAAGVGLAGKFSSLKGGAVAGLASKVGSIMGKRGFVVEEVDALQKLGIGSHGHGVATISVGTPRISGKSELSMGPDATIGVGPVSPFLDGIDGEVGDMEEVDHVAANVGKRRFLSEKESTARHAMLEGDRGNAERAVIIDDCRVVGRKTVEDDFVANAAAEEVELRAEELFKRFAGAIDVKLGCASEEVEGGDKANKPKTVVSVEMRNEDVVKTRKFETGLSESELCALGTIDHKEFFTHIYYLRRGQMFCSGQRTAAAEYVYVEFFHCKGILRNQGQQSTFSPPPELYGGVFGGL